MGVLPQAAAVVVAAVIFTLIYDPFHAGLLAFIALAPLTLVFTDPNAGCSLPRAAFCGFAFGLLASMAIVGPWMFAASVDYFDRSAVWSFAFTLFINALYVALFYAPLFVVLRLLAFTPPLARALGAACAWIAFESLRSMDPAGNAWALLGQGFANLPLLREAAAYGGAAGLGLGAALCGSAIGIAMQPDIGARDALGCVRIAVAAPTVLALLGVVVSKNDRVHAPLSALRVAVVQAEIASRDIWDPAQRVAHWNAYLEATETIPPGKADLVVWPESAAPFLLDSDPAAQSRLAELSAKLDAAILLGAPRTKTIAEGRAALLNSVYFFAPGIAQPRTYDKQRLLPFVETTAALNSGDQAMDYAPGSGPELFNVRGWQIAPLLCFEAVYPQYARAAVQRGAHLLVNLSNDAWFAGGAGPEQHYSMSRLRTVELRRSMVRASNGGISAAIGADGQEIGFPIRRRKAVHIYEIPPPSRMTTTASTHPNVVGWLSAALTLLALTTATRARHTAR